MTKILASGVVTEEWLSQIDLTKPTDWVTIDGVGYKNDGRIAIFSNFKLSIDHVEKLDESVSVESVKAAWLDAKLAKAEQFTVFRRELVTYRERLQPAVPTTYTAKKGLTDEAFISRAALSDADKPDQLLIWFTDVDGEPRGYQTIYGNGEKRIEKGTHKKGAMCFVHRAAVEQTALYITEGWATACSVTKFVDPNESSVVMAIDSGNLGEVGEALRAKYPTAKLVFCADNDHATAIKTGSNPGLIAAREAAELVSGVVVFPEGKGSDWNDLAGEIGEGKARKAFEKALKLAQKEEVDQYKQVMLSRDSRDTGYHKAILKNNSVVWVLDYKTLLEDFDAQFNYRSVEGTFLVRESGGFYKKLATIEAETWAYSRIVNPDTKQPARDHEIKEFISALFRRNFVKMDSINPAGFINFKNGLLQVKDLAFTPHTDHDKICMTQVPCEWARGMATPNWTAWLTEVFGESETKKKILLEYMGYCLSGDDPTTFDQKALVMLGSGGNGKSTALNLLKYMAGQGDSLGYSVFPMKKFSEYLVCFDAATKIFNVSSEEPKFWNDEISQVFKKIVSGEEMSARTHHKEFFTYRARFKLIMACNTAPMSKDSSDGLYRRMIYLKFDKSFIGHEDHGIEARLKSEVSGIVEEALRAYADARLRGSFTVDESSVEIKEEMQKSSDWVHDFADENLVFDGGKADTDQLYLAFLDFKDRVGLRDYVTKRAFVRLLCAAFKLEKGRSSASRFVTGISIRGVKTFGGSGGGESENDAGAEGSGRF